MLFINIILFIQNLLIHDIILGMVIYLSLDLTELNLITVNVLLPDDAPNLKPVNPIAKIKNYYA